VESLNIKVQPDSHVHGGMAENLDWALSHLRSPESAPISSWVKQGPAYVITLRGAPVPADSGLYGPASGDPPVEERDVVYANRPPREYPSRIIPGKPLRSTDRVTVVCGPSEEHPCVLYTIYGGPEACQEVNDPRVRDLEAARRFWSEHALTEDSR